MTDDQSRKIVRLWQGLDDVDKQRVTYAPRFQPKLVSGRFPRTKSRRLVPGIESIRRAFIGPGTPAQKPSLSPIVESVCMEVVHKYRRSTTVHTAKGRLCVPKWTKVIDGYTHLKYLVDTSPIIQTQTTLQLFSINLHTLRQW